MNSIAGGKIRNKELANKSDIFGFINNTDLNKYIETLLTKAELKADPDITEKLKTSDSSFFIGQS